MCEAQIFLRACHVVVASTCVSIWLSRSGVSVPSNLLTLVSLTCLLEVETCVCDWEEREEDGGGDSVSRCLAQDVEEEDEGCLSIGGGEKESRTNEGSERDSDVTFVSILLRGLGVRCPRLLLIDLLALW